MNLIKHIENNYKSKYDFAKQNNISNQLVSYWCSKDWNHLSRLTKERITKITNKKDVV